MIGELSKENSQHADLHQLPVGHRRLHADDRSARHGHRHDQGVRDPRARPASAIRPGFRRRSAKCSSPPPRGLFIAIPAFGAFYFPAQPRGGVLHHIQDTMNSLFRKMPYDRSPARTSATKNSTPRSRTGSCQPEGDGHIRPPLPDSADRAPPSTDRSAAALNRDGRRRWRQRFGRAGVSDRADDRRAARAS